MTAQGTGKAHQPNGSVDSTANSSGTQDKSGKQGVAAGGVAAGSDNPALDARIRATQDALRKAGVKLQQAGQAIATAQSPEELAKARQLLAQARILVIVTSQDVQDARQQMGNASADQSRALDNAQKSLDNATVALVVANNALLGLPTIRRIPTNTGVVAGGSGSDKVRKLDKKLDKSLAVYDGTLEKARQGLGQTGAPTNGTVSNDASSQVPKLPGQASSGGGASQNQDKQPGKTVAGANTGANSIGSSTMDKQKNQQVAMKVPQGVGSGQDDDIVAKQLREAAMAEKDPQLRKKLWDEYKRYKAGL